MFTTRQNQNPQLITQVESWLSINNIINENLDNCDIGIPDISDFFTSLRTENNQGIIDRWAYNEAQIQKLRGQIQELKSQNEELQANIDLYDKKIQMFDSSDTAIQFKIRILIRQKCSTLIQKFKQLNEERKSNFKDIENKLSTEPIKNLLKNRSKISNQIINAEYQTNKERMEVISQKVNSPND
ncbi:hypothetical protein M9Y10_044297 [Tritrichomonas musculus]|uniref:Uncharacterized protein n=1 Tax=Tritrichomonas musculus TaxID=1915356 RepID=A0ABR2K2Z8_9EUKA